MPPRPGGVVRRATGSERAQALYFDQMDNQVPKVGRGRDGAPIYLNLEFLDGTRGAHVSISGISGVATKTSFALFLMHSTSSAPGALGARGGERESPGLQREGRGPAVPRPAQHPPRRRPARAPYAALGLLEAGPFGVGRLLGAADLRRQNGTAQMVTGWDQRGGEAFWWTLREFCDIQRLLPLRVRRRRGRAPAVHEVVIHQVAARLRRYAEPFGDNGAVLLEGEARLTTYEELGRTSSSTRLDDRRRHPRGLGGPGHQRRERPTRFVRHGCTLVAAASSAAHYPRRPARAGRGRASRHGISQLTVVDLHNLHERAQRLRRRRGARREDLRAQGGGRPGRRCCSQ